MGMMVIQRHEFKFGNTNVIGDGVEINGRWFVEQEWLEKFVEMHSERSQQLAAKEAENKALRSALKRIVKIYEEPLSTSTTITEDIQQLADEQERIFEIAAAALGKGG